MDGHRVLRNVVIVAFYGHAPSQEEIDANARNKDTFFACDVAS